MSSEAKQRAFVDRLERHRGILLKVANAYCRNPADRDDLVQETAAQLWRAYGRFDESASFATWAYRVAVNVAISFHRSGRRRQQQVVPASEASLESLPAPAAAEADDRLALVREFIEGFDELNRALMLLYLDDRPYAEIAAILGITETNVATKITRNKARLKRSIGLESHIDKEH